MKVTPTRHPRMSRGMKSSSTALLCTIICLLLAKDAMLIGPRQVAGLRLHKEIQNNKQNADLMVELMHQSMLSVATTTTSNASNATNNSKPARPTGNASTSAKNGKNNAEDNTKEHREKNRASTPKNATAKRGNKANASAEDKNE